MVARGRAHTDTSHGVPGIHRERERTCSCPEVLDHALTPPSLKQIAYGNLGVVLLLRSYEDDTVFR